MNKRDAKYIAEIIDDEQLAYMFERAMLYVKDWKQASIVNPSITKGVAWNIFFDGGRAIKNSRISKLVKINMVREFGEFISDQFTLPRKRVRDNIITYHQDPIFEVHIKDE